MPAITDTETPFDDKLVSISTFNYSVMMLGILWGYFINIHFFLQMQSSMQIGKKTKQ